MEGEERETKKKGVTEEKQLRETKKNLIKKVKGEGLKKKILSREEPGKSKRKGLGKEIIRKIESMGQQGMCLLIIHPLHNSFSYSFI